MYDNIQDHPAAPSTPPLLASKQTSTNSLLFASLAAFKNSLTWTCFMLCFVLWFAFVGKVRCLQLLFLFQQKFPVLIMSTVLETNSSLCTMTRLKSDGFLIISMDIANVKARPLAIRVFPGNGISRLQLSGSKNKLVTVSIFFSLNHTDVGHHSLELRVFVLDTIKQISNRHILLWNLVDHILGSILKGYHSIVMRLNRLFQQIITLSFPLAGMQKILTLGDFCISFLIFPLLVPLLSLQ